jgi:hypothetical protein
MYKIIIKNEIYIFETWNEVQDFLYAKENEKKKKSKKNKENCDLIKIITNKSFTVLFDDPVNDTEIKTEIKNDVPEKTFYHK